MTSPPDWLIEMADKVTGQLNGFDILAPLGCHYYLNRARQQWEVTVFASNTETVGGSMDGKITPSKFGVDMLGLMEVFTHTERLHWQALKLGPDDELGPHLSLEGDYEGHLVWLRILATAPDRYTAGRYFSAYDMRLVDEW